MLARLRPLYNKLVVPLGKASANLGLTPDFWTLFSLFTAVLASILIYQGYFWWSLVMVIIMYLADMLDGATARAKGTSSKFGTVLDHVVDRYAEYIVLSGLLIGGWISPAAAMISSSGVIMASYVRAKAESAGRSLAEISIWIVGLISHITAVQRLIYARTVLLKQRAIEVK
jgi:phosphatidylglycerophosphate synthase